MISTPSPITLFPRTWLRLLAWCFCTLLLTLPLYGADTARQTMFTAMTSGPWPQTTPERLARMQQMMAQHQSAMASVVDATRRFYDQLDPAQKRAFDAAPMMMMMGPGMGGMGLMRGQWGGGGMSGGPMMVPPPPPPSDE